MSDFFSSGWGIYIAVVTALGILWCVWLLFSQRKTKVVTRKDGTVEDTGHEWDGDLRELNNPLPRWWMWMYLLSCVFGAVYLTLYPGMGEYAGVLKYSTTEEHRLSVEEANAELKPLYAKYMAMNTKQVASDPQAHEIGQRLFLNHCAQCHGSDAGGSKGFPNLTDHDWLYGGEPETIRATILHGRRGMMPPMGGALDAEKIKDTANYVRSLSGLSADQTRAARGQEIFKAMCVACHGEKGAGNPAIGSANLTDRTWLYGGSEETIVETIAKGRNGNMPAHESILTPEKVQMLVGYVWGLSNTDDGYK
jgi:cytochrome c oxidase cbb3-type subunit 3